MARIPPLRTLLTSLLLLLLLLLAAHLSSPSISANLFFFSYYPLRLHSSPPPFEPPISPPPPPHTPPPPSDLNAGPPNEAAPSDGGAGKWRWEICVGSKKVSAVDYVPCLDNVKAIKELKSRRRMEHRQRYCPKPSPRCLVPLPEGYKVPVPWPRSRDQIWFDNVPHSKLVDYKKDQNWVRISGEYFVFPGGGTQFKEGVMHYILFIEQIFPAIEWGG